jgi:hypothetical protein
LATDVFNGQTEAVVAVATAGVSDIANELGGFFGGLFGG